MTFLQALNSPALQESLFIPKVALIALSAVLLGFVVFALVRSSWFRLMYVVDSREFLTFRPYGIRRMARQWRRTMARLSTANEAEYKLAVIEADGVLADVLKRMGFGGENAAEQLAEVTPVMLPNVERLREAHRVRNNVVHDPDYRLSLQEARETLAVYEEAFRSLDLI